MIEQGNSLVLLTLFTFVNATAPLASLDSSTPQAYTTTKDHSRPARNIMHSTTTTAHSSPATVVGVGPTALQSEGRFLVVAVAGVVVLVRRLVSKLPPTHSRTITTTASYTMRNNLRRHCCSTGHIVGNTDRRSRLVGLPTPPHHNTTPQPSIAIHDPVLSWA